MGAPEPVALFNTLIKQIFADLNRCTAACKSIKTNRHCGNHHTALDELQTSLKAGLISLKVAAEGAAAKSPSAEDLATADGAVGGYAKEIKHVCHKLEKLAKGHHDSHHHVEHPHFGELKAKWEDALKGLVVLLGGFGEGVEEVQVKIETLEVKTELETKVEEVVASKKETEAVEEKHMDKKVEESKEAEVTHVKE